MGLIGDTCTSNVGSLNLDANRETMEERRARGDHMFGGQTWGMTILKRNTEDGVEMQCLKCIYGVTRMER